MNDTKIAFNLPDDVMEFMYYAKRKLGAKDLGEVIGKALIALRKEFAEEKEGEHGK